MIGADQAVSAKPQAGGFLEIIDHFFREMFVFADDHMNVIGHDGKAQAVAGVAMFANCFTRPLV